MNTKKWLYLVAAGMVVMGLALSAGALALGASWDDFSGQNAVVKWWGATNRWPRSWNFVHNGKDVPALPKTQSGQTVPQTQQIETMCLVFGAGDVDVTYRRGSEFSVQSDSGSLYGSLVEGGEWTLDFSGVNRDEKVVVTVPKTARLDKVEFSVAFGDVHIEGLDCADNWDISCDAGNLEMKNCTAEYADIAVGAGNLKLKKCALTQGAAVECGMGNAELQLRRPENCGAEIEVGMGNVTVDGQKYSGVAHDVCFGSGSEPFYSVECGLGNVEIKFFD